LLAPLAADLAEWRLACGRPADTVLVFPAGNEQLWHRHDWQNWRSRIFRSAACAAGLDSAVPYDLRHAFCSLLLAEGRTLLEVAAQLGHAPSMTSDTYGHVIQEARRSARTRGRADTTGTSDTSSAERRCRTWPKETPH
jgi:site-specific recombinase XerD